MSVTESKGHIDYIMGNKVKKIMEKYVNTELNEKTCDLIIEDLRAAFGKNIEAQVTVDTDINDIEIMIRDANKRIMKCSSLTLFKDE
jgi:hypothetical protein